MTDKLKALVAKWEARILHRLTIAENNPNRQEREVAEVTAEAFKLALNELKSALAEQAPAGEFDARALATAWLEHAHGEEPCEVPGGQSEDSDVDCLAFQFRKAYAAGRSSQPAEPRDPAGK